MPSSGPPDPMSIDRPWTKAYPPGVPPDYHVPDVALPRFLDDAVRDFPHRAALVAEARPIDHVTVRDRVAHLADVLRATGVGPGDRVLLGLPTGASFPVALFAIWRLAAIAVPVSPELDADGLRAVLADGRVGTAIGVRRFARALPDAPEGPATVIVIDDDGWLASTQAGRVARLLRRLRQRLRRPLRRDKTPPEHLEGMVRLERTLGAAGPTSGFTRSGRPPGAGDLAIVSYDSHDRSPPVGTAWTHGSLVAAAFQARLWVPDIQAGSERILVAEPMAGTTGPAVTVLGPLLGTLAGASVLGVGHLDDAELVRAIERHGPTLLVVAVERVRALLAPEAAKRDMSSLRVVLTIGTGLDPDTALEVERRTGGARVRACVGLAGAALTHAQPVYGRSVPDAMGLPVTGTVAAVVDPDHLDVLCPPGRPGRLVVHGPQLAEPTDDRFAAGWLISDELVCMDDDGVFHHVGALDEVIDRDGTWVSPRRIEAALLRHQAVRRAGVVAGERPGSLLAAVVCGRRGRPTAEELLMHCRAHLDSPAVPDEVILLDELPETETGDLARDELRALLRGR